jgi:primase-polymerase (primpol)-like protein
VCRGRGAHPSAGICAGEAADGCGPGEVGARPRAAQSLGAVAERRWIIWRYETDAAGKVTKVPYQAARPDRKASSTNPKTWTDYATAVAAAAGNDDVDGIGFQLFGSDFGAFDVDDCRDPKTGTLHPWVKEFLARANSYTEITVSQKGLRVIGRIDKTVEKISRKQPIGDGASLETYRNIGRYIAMTGNVLPGSPMKLT